MNLQPCAIGNRQSAIGNLAVGTDLVLISRIEDLIARYGVRFMARVYTEREVADCGGRVASLAARWAAKEAVAKAFGTGIGAVGFRDIEVLRAGSGRPELQLHGAAAALARQQGLTTWAISLSHDGGMALAFVVAVGKEARDAREDPGRRR